MKPGLYCRRSIVAWVGEIAGKYSVWGKCWRDVPHLGAGEPLESAWIDSERVEFFKRVANVRFRGSRGKKTENYGFAASNLTIILVFRYFDKKKPEINAPLAHLSVTCSVKKSNNSGDSRFLVSVFLVFVDT